MMNSPSIPIDVFMSFIIGYFKPKIKTSELH